MPNEWNPIATARDEYIIGWNEAWDGPHEVYMLFGKWHFDDDTVADPQPTHWHPMPDIPTTV